MQLSSEQEKAVDLAYEKYKRNDLMTVIAGFAGTGKSTLIRYFIDKNDLMGSTHFCTYTGKASLVLQKQGLPATTIHSLIYTAYYNKRSGKFVFMRKPSLEDHIKLIVVDEISMVPPELLTDLMRYRIPVIALGDPGQLEPISNADNHLLQKPDIFLTEIHRQALDNSIIRLSMDIREGKSLQLEYDDPNVKVIKKEEVTTGMLTWADQIMVSKNATRHMINDQMRELYGYNDPYPMKGEKIICLRNYWKTINDGGYALTNGAIGTVSSRLDLGMRYRPNHIRIDFQPDFDNHEFHDLKLNGKIILRESYQWTKAMSVLFDFDYGYAITVHKSQGSQFEKVFLYNEPMHGTDHKRLLYTAVTRAADKIVIAI